MARFSRSSPKGLSSQRGMSLIMIMALIVGILILAVMSVGGNITSERASANSRDTDLAFQAAEYALRTGETYSNALNGPATGTSSCTGATAGVCYLGTTNWVLSGSLAWNGLPLSQAALCPAGFGCGTVNSSIMDNATSGAGSGGCNAATATPGTGPAISMGTNGTTAYVSPTGETVAFQPTMLIEVLPSLVPGQDSGTTNFMYRVTAKAWGVNCRTQVVLQSVFFPIHSTG